MKWEGACFVPRSDCPGRRGGRSQTHPTGPTSKDSLLGQSLEPQGKNGDSRATTYSWQVVDCPRARPRGPVVAEIQPTLCSPSHVPGAGCIRLEKGQPFLIHPKLPSGLAGTV